MTKEGVIIVEFRYKAMSESGPAVVWIRVGNTRRRDLLAWFEMVFFDVVAALERGEPLVEISNQGR